MSEPLGVRPVMSEPFHKRHRRWLIGWSIAAVFLVFVGIANIGAGDTEGTSSSNGETQADAGTSADDKYEQTWPKSYSSTTCREWNGEMTTDQRWTAAADMLTGARNKGDGGQGVPPDSLVDEFMGGITTACVVPDMSLAEVGAGLYLTERARFRP
jgi:hypothetical protein